MAQKFTYSRWDGTQSYDDLDADQVLEAISDDLMNYGDLVDAINRLHRWGSDDIQGLEQLLKQLREQRESELSRWNLDSTLDDLKREVQEIVDQERSGIDQRLRDMPEGSPRNVMEKVAKSRQDQLDRLPDELGGRVKALRDYEFVDQHAAQRFQDLLQKLQQQTLDRMFQGMKQSIQSTTPQDLSRIRDMVKDLNKMLDDRLHGRKPDFESFMQKYGDMFPPGLNSLDDLLEHLQQQMAQMQSLLQSMSPQARAELESLIDSMIQDDSLRLELAKLGGFMAAMAPPSDLTERYPFFGDQTPGLGQAMSLMERMQQMERLESQLERGAYRPQDIDPSLAEEVLGPEARQALERLRRLTQMLEKAGYVERKDRRLELTPKGMRRIGKQALRDIFEQLRKTKFGQHPMFRTGLGSDAGDDVKEYEYGDPFLIDLRETLFNSLERQGRGTPIRMKPEDFMVRRTEHTTQASTVLMIDMSRSMFLRGCFLAAKKVAIALDALIRAQFPRDSLYIVGFSNYAVELKPEALPQVTINDFIYGTNMQHAFQLSRSLLAKHAGNKQIVMITDGEPTAHLENGRAYFSYPPMPRTIQETLREIRRCTRDGIVINTFMLERGPYLTEFVNHMSKINRGRAFFVTPDRLGEYILVDYLQGRQRRRSRAAS